MGLWQFSNFGLASSYLERNNSSLVYMVKVLLSKPPQYSGFFLNDYKGLIESLKRLTANPKQKILFNQSNFGLLT